MSELEFKTYLVDYELDGVRWSIEVRASSPEDALRRLRRAAAWGIYVGVLHARIPAFPGCGLIVRCLTWLANKLQL